MLSKCCCCVPLRTGAIVLGVLGVIGGILYFFNPENINIIQGLFGLIAYGVLLFGALKNNQVAVLAHLVLNALQIVVGIVIGILVITTIATMLPQFGDNCARLNLPDHIYTKDECDALKSATMGTVASIFFIGSLLNIYFWVCVYSYFKELKSGGGNPV